MICSGTFFFSFFFVIVLASEEIERLLQSCFDKKIIAEQGPVRRSFTIKGKDNFRYVELTLQVTGDIFGRHCALEWDASGIVELNSGKLISIYQATGEPVKPTTSKSEFVAIGIDIFNFPVPHWELSCLYPNGLVSGKFIKSFIVKAMNVHRKMLPEIPLQFMLSDQSQNREMYWLEKGRGKTYYQGVWNVEYECLKEKYGTRLSDFLLKSAMADLAPAHIALSDKNLEPIPLPNAKHQYDVLFFSKRFIRELQEWNATKTQHQIMNMNIRQALNDFMPRWKRPESELSESMKVALAKNTFTYFFRNHPDWDALARQVLLNFDSSCIYMTGAPLDPNPIPMTFSFTSPFATSQSEPGAHSQFQSDFAGASETTSEQGRSETTDREEFQVNLDVQQHESQSVPLESASTSDFGSVLPLIWSPKKEEHVASSHFENHSSFLLWSCVVFSCSFCFFSRFLFTDSLPKEKTFYMNI